MRSEMLQCQNLLHLLKEHCRQYRELLLPCFVQIESDGALPLPRWWESDSTLFNHNALTFTAISTARCVWIIVKAGVYSFMCVQASR